MRGHSALIAVWLLLGALAAPCAAQGTITLTYVGAGTVPTGTVVEGVEFGGISGIFYHPYSDRFVAVTDDSRNAGASRWWTLSLAYTGTSFTSVAVESQTQLRTAGGDPLPLADTEGIAGNLDGSFFVSHEGLAAGTDAVSSIPPWIWRFDGATGRRVAQVALPVKFLPGDASGNPVAPGASNQSRGVVSNLSLECLGLSPSRRFLFTANEAALRQDYNGTYNSDFNQAQNSETRIVRFTNVPGAPVASEEKVYRADQGQSLIFLRLFNTVPEILPVDDTGRMLVLERGLTQSNTNLGSYRIRIYLVDFNQADATNVAGINALVGASYTRLGKTLLWESSTNMDNVEAMCWGRDIDGFRTLVLASDNNFSASQVSQFHVLRTNIPAVARRNLALAASGSGSVTASPAVPWYPDGADVTVTAAASPQWTFDGWSGASGGAANPLNLAMNTDRSLAASFLAPYDIWRRTHFTAEEIAEGIITAVSADPDGDGAPNLLECALGLDPRAAGASGLPGGALAGDWFTLTYLKDPSRADIRWQVEAADTLGDNSPWVPVPDELVGTEGGLERRRAALPLSGERGFLRLRLDRLF